MSEIKTQFEQSGQQLQACRTRILNLMTKSLLGILIVDMNRTIRFVNPVAAAIFGCQARELLDSQFEFQLEPGKTVALDLSSKDGKIVAVEMWAMETEWDAYQAHIVTLQDVTERKRTELELRKLYRAVLGSPSIVMITDAKGVIEFVNPKFTEVTGYTPAEVLGRNPRILKSGKVAPEVYQELWETIHAGREWRGEMVNRKKNGELYWEFAAISPIRDTKGNITNFVAVTEVITGRKMMEEALHREKIFTDTVINGMPGIFYIFDEQGRIIRWNKRLEEFSGHSPEEMPSKRPHDFVAEEDHGLLESKLREVLVEHRDTDAELLLLDREGRKIPFSCTGSPMSIDGTAYLVGLGIDITERARAEEALRISEERYRALFRDNPTMIATLDGELTMVSVNPFCASQLGYTIDELEGQSVLKIFYEDDRTAVAEQLQRCLQNSNQVYRWQFRKVRKDGGMLWVEEIAQAVHNLNGVLNILVVCQDITERKQSEEEREQLLIQLDAVLNSINEGVIISDLNGSVLSMNPSALAIHEYESVEQVRRQLHQYQDTFELSDLDGRPLPFEQWPLARAFRGERFTDYEVRVLRKDTGKLWFGSYSGTPVQTKSGDVILAVVTLRDITERKQAEEALRKYELKFSKIFHSVPALIGITTLAEGRCIDINEAGLRTLGYKREEMLGKTMLELGVWESKSVRDRMIRQLEDDGIVRDLEINFVGKNGKTFTGLFSAEPIDFNGDRYMLSIVNDITERKRMEEEIVRLNTDLAARAAELEGANRELEAFNYTVAHDLRKPLTVINGYCQAIRELCGDKLDEACKGYLQEAYDGTLRMNRLIDALLNFSRLAHVEPRRETLDLSAMVHEVGKELQMAEPGRRVTFLIAEGVSVKGDAALLRVAMDNLLGNAWKYTCTRADGIIEFGAAELDGKPVWFVRDNGVGFEMKDADKLFAPFQRLPGAEECRGFGIGLATVERIMRRHGGKIWAEGEPGKGACFYFTLSAV